MSGSKSSDPGGSAAHAQAIPARDPLQLTVYELDAPADGAARLEPALSGAQAAARQRTGRIKMLLVLAVCAAPVIASYFSYYVLRPGGRANYGALIQPTRALPAALPLRSLAGTPVVPATLHGQWLLVVVAPSACDAGCEKRLHAQRQLREMLGRERDRIDKVLFVTDDAPLRPALAQALAAEPAVTVLRVPQAALAGWLAPEAGRGLDEHLYVVDPMGEWMMRFPAEFDPSKVKRDLDRLLRASAGWDKPGR